MAREGQVKGDKLLKQMIFLPLTERRALNAASLNTGITAAGPRQKTPSQFPAGKRAQSGLHATEPENRGSAR